MMRNREELREKVLALCNMNVKSMKTYLKEQEVKGYSKLKKAQLQELCYEVMIDRTIKADNTTVENKAIILADNVNKVTFNTVDSMLEKAKSSHSINGLIQAFGGKARSKQECILLAADEVRGQLQHNKNTIDKIEEDKIKVQEFNSKMKSINSNIRVKQEVYLDNKSLRNKLYLCGSNLFREVYNSIESDIVIPALNIGRCEHNEDVYDEIYTDINCLYVVEYDNAESEEDAIQCKIDMYAQDMVNFNNDIDTIKYDVLQLQQVKADMFMQDFIDIDAQDGSVRYSIQERHLLDDINKSKGIVNNENCKRYVDVDSLIQVKQQIELAENNIDNVKDAILNSIK